MLGRVTFTPTFLHTPILKEQAESSQAASQANGPISYLKSKHGTVDAFVRSADFAQFKSEYQTTFARIVAFVEAHGDLLVPPNPERAQKEIDQEKKERIDKVKQQVAVLERHLFEDNYFNPRGGTDHREEMYSTCKQWFHKLDELLQNDKLPPQARMTAVMDLAPRLDACSGGIMADLQGTVSVLKAASEGISGLAYKWKKQMLDALILNHVKVNHAYPAGEEIHYVQAYYNELASRMGMEKTCDPYADKLVTTDPDTGIRAITEEQLNTCTKQILQKLKLKPTGLAADIAEQYRSRIEESLRNEKLDPDHIDASEGFDKLKTTFKNLREEYGDVNHYDVLEPSEDYTAIAYVGARNPTRGARHFLRMLKDAGLVDYERQQENEKGEKVGRKSTIELGRTSEGRIKMLGDLLWLKEGKGKDDGTIQEFPAVSLLKLAPEELLDKIEQGGRNAQERALLLRDLVRRVHASLEAAGKTGETLEPWLKGLAAKMKEIAARQPGEAEPSWERGWINPVTLLAAAFGQGAVLGELLEAGGDKNARNEDDRTALMLAAQGGHLPIVRILLDQNAAIDLKDQNGNTALRLAISNNRGEVVAALLEKNVSMEDKNAALWFAAQLGRTQVLEALLSAGADKEAKDNNGLTTLMIAALYGKVETLESLLRAGADKEAKNSRGATALMFAAQEGNVEALKALLSAGANKEAKNNHGITALMTAAHHGQVEVLEALLSAGANKEAKNNRGSTALIFAAKEGKVEALKALLKAGANKEARTNHRSTALMFTARYGYVDALEVLLRAGADKEARDKNRFTALMTAAHYGQVETLQALLEAGADKEARNKYKFTALMLAAQEVKVEALKALIEAGATMNESDWNKLVQRNPNMIKDFMAVATDDGERAMNAKAFLLNAMLQLAQEGATHLVKKLVKAGADKIQDAEGKTALMRAVGMMESDSEKGLQTLKTLLKAGADITIQDTRQMTVADYAEELATQESNANNQALLALREQQKKNAGPSSWKFWKRA